MSFFFPEALGRKLTMSFFFHTSYLIPHTSYLEEN
jgi:hypothetical protein